MTPLADAKVPEKIAATFECDVSTDVKDEDIVWMKDGQKITPDDKFQVKRDGRRLSLAIQDTSPEDSGQYTIKIGDKTQTADLKVQGGYQPYFCTVL